MKKVFITILFTAVTFLSSAQNVEWKDIAHIFYDNCATCHRPGEIGEQYIFANSYKALTDSILSPYFPQIRPYVDAKLMPPWKADPSYHHYLDERILSPADTELIGRFVDQVIHHVNNPGDTTQAPLPPVFATGSQLGTPDTVLTMAEPFTIPGDFTDHYQCFVLHTNLLADSNVKAIEFRAGNPKVVHHVFIYTCTDNSADSLDALTPNVYGYPSFGGAGDGVNADFLTLYGPGLTPRFYPEGSGIKFKANTKLIIQVHYAPTTEEQTDQSSLNIFYESNPEIRVVKGKRVGENYILEPVFFIPKNHVVTFHSSYTMDTTYSMFSIAPHMHLLGQNFKIYATTPAGDTIPLCFIPSWYFQWQLLYNFPCYVILPQGTIIHSIATYDNTVNNLNNPNNPPVNVAYGESSFDEMDKYFMNLLTYEHGDEFVIFDTALCALTDVPPIGGIVSTPQLYNPLPNPASDQTMIEYYLPDYTKSRMFIYDALGRLTSPVTQEIGDTPGFHRNFIDVGDFIPGLYLIVLEADGRRITKPLMVQH